MLKLCVNCSKEIHQYKYFCNSACEDEHIEKQNEKVRGEENA